MGFEGSILSDAYREKGHLFTGMQIIKMVMQQQRMEEQTRRRVLDEVRVVVGDDNCSDNPAVLASYSLYPLVIPEIAVIAESVEHVQGVLEVANRHRVAVTPLATATVSLSTGVFVPGGIVLDTSGLNRILEINTGDGYALIEPGVTYGQLCSALKDVGHWYPLGSFHHAVSVLGPSTTQNHGGRGCGGWDEICSFEVVLPDGTVVRTGGSMVEGGSWAHQYVNFPDLHGLWLESNGMLGVITKMAVRIYPEGESSRIHLAGFDDYGTAQEYVKRICRQGVARHQVIFWWHGLMLVDHFSRLKHRQQDQVGSLPFEWLIRGRKPPDGIPYNTVVTELKGYREVVEASESVCDRVATELGGRPVPWEEFAGKHPDSLEFFEDYAINKQPNATLVNLITKTMGAFSVMPIVWVGIGSPEKMRAVEEFIWEELAGRRGLGVWIAYSHPFDQGRCFFLRFYTYRLGEDRDLILQDTLENADFTVRMVREFGCFPHKPPLLNLEAKMILEMTGGYGKLLERIKKVVDPNGIMSPHVDPFGEAVSLEALLGGGGE